MQKQGGRYSVRVKAGVKGVERVEVLADDSLVVWTHARAHDGEANKAVISLLAEYFRVAKGAVRIIAGTKSKNKVIEIDK